jgi:rod shape-determining protein MreC
VLSPEAVFDIRRRTGFILLAVLTAQIVLISAQVRFDSGVPVIESVTFGFFSGIQRLTFGLVDGVGNMWARYSSLQSVAEENTLLRQQVANLQVQLQNERARARRSESLQQLLNFRKALPWSTVAAEVIAVDATPWFRTVTIARGTRDGLQTDLAVLAPAGVVGRVVGPLGANAAKVQLLVDRNAAIGAMLERSRSTGIVTGHVGDLPLRFDYISNLADVQVGDRVVTSGSEGIYPKGYLIGVVESVQMGRGLYQDSGLYQDIGVRPVVDFGALEDVLVIMERRPADLPSGGTQ